MGTTPTVVRRNDAEGRYEIVVDGVVAGFTEFFADGDVLVFPHTLVEPEYEGRGLATALVTGALDDVRARGEKIRATCPFVRSFLAKHPEYHDLEA